MKEIKIPQSIRVQPYQIYIILIVIYILQVVFPSVKNFAYLSVHINEVSFFNYLYFLYHENLLHLISNLILYFVFGCVINLKPMKPYFPTIKQIYIFIVASVISAIIFQITYHFGLHQQTEYLIGASGGVYAIVGLSLSRGLIYFKKLLQVKYMALFLVIAIYLYDQIRIDLATHENGSVYVHLAGFVIGAGYGIYYFCTNRNNTN